MNFASRRIRTRAFGSRILVGAVSGEDTLSLVFPDGTLGVVEMDKDADTGRWSLTYEVHGTRRTLAKGSAGDVNRAFETLSRDVIRGRRGRLVEIGTLSAIGGVLIGALVSAIMLPMPPSMVAASIDPAALAQRSMPPLSPMQSTGAMNRVRDPVDLDEAASGPNPPSTPVRPAPATSPSVGQDRPAPESPSGGRSASPAAPGIPSRDTAPTIIPPGRASSAAPAPTAAALAARAELSRMGEAPQPTPGTGTTPDPDPPRAAEPPSAEAASASSGTASEAAGDPLATSRLLEVIREIRVRVQNGQPIGADLLAKLPPDLAAKLVARTAPPSSEKPGPRATGAPVQGAFPESVMKEHRDQWGIPDIPDAGSWAALGGKIVLPMPGGGDIRTHGDLEEFGVGK